MSKFTEQLENLKTTLQDRQKRMQEIAGKAVDEQRSMDTAEAQEFDNLEAEVKSLGNDIERYSKLQTLDAATAQPLEKSNGASATFSPAGIVVKKAEEKLEPGIRFARLARVKGLSLKTGVPATDVVKQLYPNDGILGSTVSKAAVPAANTGNEPWAGVLVTEGGLSFADFVEYLTPMTIVGQVQSRLRRLPFNTPVLVQTSIGTAGWVREGAAKPLTQWGYSSIKMDLFKVAAIAAATQEQLERASIAADALLRDELARAVARTIDETFFNPAIAPVAGVSPGSILNGITAVPASTPSADSCDPAANIRCDLQNLISQFVNANQSLEGAFFIMPANLAVALSLMVSPLGNPEFPGLTFNGGTLLGIPVFVSQYAAVGGNNVVALVKGDEIFLADDGGVRVDASDQASLVMDTAPNMNSTTPTGAANMVSMWQTNSVAFRVERFINWQRRRAESVAYMNANWSLCAPAASSQPARA